MDKRRWTDDTEKLLPFGGETQVIDLEGDRSKKRRALQEIRTDAHTLRSMAIAIFAVVAFTSVVIIAGLIAASVVVSGIVADAQSAVHSAETILRKPELAATIDRINAIVSDGRISSGVARVSDFMSSPEISNILTTVNGMIERLPELEAAIMPLVAGEIANISATVDKYMTAASSFDPIETINYLQKNRLLERVVAIFNLVDRLTTSEQVQQLQQLSVKLETVVSGLQERGITVHL